MSSKSTFSNSTSKSYAIALYELSREKSELNKVEDGMKGLNKLLDESSDFREMISNPTIKKEDIIPAAKKDINYLKINDFFSMCFREIYRELSLCFFQ